MIKNSTMKSTDLTTFQNKSTTNATNQQSTTPVNGINNNPYFFYTGFQCSPTNLIMSSGQCSPSDTLDSGTCSDLDMTPPPLPKKKNSKTNLNSTSTVSITAINGKKNGDSSAEECEDSESNVSCDSLNDGSSDLLIMESTPAKSTTILPRNLLQDIREHRNNVKNTSTKDNVETKIIPQPPVVASVLEKTTTPAKVLINESTYEDRKKEKQDSGKNNNIISGNYLYETDRFYKFHLNENVFSDNVSSASSSLVSSPTDTIDDENECFAGYKDLLGGEVASTIRSAKGTVRGVKNRVRAGIATFLQIQQTTTKSYREKDAGKVVVYSTTMGIVRNTYHECLKVKQILRTHMVKFEERDVFMSSEYQAEIRDRMQSEQILIPQVFVDGQHIGDAETIDRLNESGELRRILKPYKSADACSTCQVCGGYRLLPCPVCNGSKKSVHRNHFTTEFVALKCMNCDEVGLVRCYNC
ncbi:glutaredoxin domain-containing cysteine-rich protein CG31559-like [Chrysoperla carnea]|uniref:glutaredoxin domain-containing cysteine-rich protein CG31559-like n=1 Tax=Chrysoperla carnea TaxID=189513 RepID=UPI001D072214|nr:glutaredoxin domain-containing cysteine-rich protein CG31559-like [Chrysoperla carnea]